MRILAHLEPAEVFRYFEEIAQIPHGSGNTRLISDYLVRFAKERRLEVIQDASGNVVIRKDGTEGYEDSGTVMLQGHMDMICEKEPWCTIDLEHEGLALKVEDGIVSAEGTTLGGDDGIAVAYMLALLDSDSIPHPPVEAVFTVDEEIGMLGAAALDKSGLKARYMINIDSEEEGYLLTSCAGGAAVVCRLVSEREACTGTAAYLTVTGGLGGHSGVDIDKGRANADRILGRALRRMIRDADFRIISAEGGTKDNAIPARARAKLLFINEEDAEAAGRALAEADREVRAEYRETDPEITLSLTEDTDPGGQPLPMTKDLTERFIGALCDLPGGVQRMSEDIPGLVKTSLNLGILETDDDGIRMTFSVRSSENREKEDLIRCMETVMKSHGGTLARFGDYPAWEYRRDSRLRDLMVEIFEEMYGRKPVVHAIHAGVECGHFAGTMPDLDCISIGPDMHDIHTPRERLDAASVKRTWEYLLEVLRRLK